MTMTHGRKRLTIVKGAKRCEFKRKTAVEEHRLPRKVGADEPSGVPTAPYPHRQKNFSGKDLLDSPLTCT